MQVKTYIFAFRLMFFCDLGYFFRGGAGPRRTNWCPFMSQIGVFGVRNGEFGV